MTRALTQAKTGQGEMLPLAGEAGWGKTRLVAEIKSRAKDQGWLYLQENCFETECSVPYAPLVELLHASGRTHTPLRKK